MTVSTTHCTISYTGDGATTSFSFSFCIGAPTDIEVYLNGALADPTTYTVSLNPVPANNVTSVGGAVSFATPPANGVKIELWRDTDICQDTQFLNQGTILQSQIEAALDKLQMQVQELYWPMQGVTNALEVTKASKVNGSGGSQSSIREEGWSTDFSRQGIQPGGQGYWNPPKKAQE